MRSLCLLPGGLGRFVPCSVGANHCRLRHVVWEKSGHGLTSRPRESASEVFLDELLLLFQYPPKSSRALLAGTLPFRYCSTRLASRLLAWRLRVPGHVAEVLEPRMVVGLRWVLRESRGLVVLVLLGKIRLNRKTPGLLVGHSVHSRPRDWKRLHCVGFSDVSGADCKGRRCNQHDDGVTPVFHRTGVG